MNVKSIHTVVYENKWQRRVQKNKPNSNPNKANFRIAKMNVSTLLTKDYENLPLFRRGKNKPNTNPIKPNSCPPSVWRVKRYLAKMGHHEAVKCVDTPPQFTLNLIKNSKAEK